MSRRAYGSGRVYVRTDSAGRETYYGSWWSNGRRVNRRLGAKRVRGTSEGMTATQAEAELRRLMRQAKPSSAPRERLTVAEVAQRYVENAQRRGRKPSTCANIESEVRVHIAPFFRDKSIDAIRHEDVTDFIAALEGKGLAPKTIRNIVASLSAISNFACSPRRRWAHSNPCSGAELPAVPSTTEIRFLTLVQVDSLIASLPAGPFIEVHARRLRHAEVAPLGTRRAARDVGCDGARTTARAVEMESSRRPRVRSPGHRGRPLEGEHQSADARRAQSGGPGRTAPLPRPAAHVRYSRGGGRCADADAAGVDGARRPHHHSDLRRLQPRRA